MAVNFFLPVNFAEASSDWNDDAMDVDTDPFWRKQEPMDIDVDHLSHSEEPMDGVQEQRPTPLRGPTRVFSWSLRPHAYLEDVRPGEESDDSEDEDSSDDDSDDDDDESDFDG